MVRPVYYIINIITAYRAFAFIALMYLVFSENEVLFRWMLAVSFLTDLIDGSLARRYKVTSIWGARLDSAADDLTFLAAAIGIIVFRHDFIRGHLVIVCVLGGLYLCQTAAALVRYGKISSFHTVLAKAAALSQGIFFLLLFFVPSMPDYFFYAAAAITVLDLAEEILLVFWLADWQANVKGLYWLIRNANADSRPH